MKIAFVIYNYSESKGGVERYAYDLTRHLVKEDHEIHIICHYLDVSLKQKFPSRVKFHIIPASGIFAALKYLSFANNAAEMLKAEQFDIIQHFGRTYFHDAARPEQSARQIYRVGSGCHWEYLKHQHPSMNHFPGRMVQSLNPRNRIIIGLERKSFMLSPGKKVICISRRVKEEIQRYYHVPDSNIVIIYNGIDPERFNPDNQDKYRQTVRADLGFSDSDILMLFVGSGFERKGLKYAIEALGAVSGDKRAVLKLLVVGKGNAERYQKIADKNGVGGQVQFIGPAGGIEQYYAAADIFLFPTLYEPFGTAVLEAMASGLPVITTSIAGASEIITDGVDSLVAPDPKDVKALADKIVFLLDDSQRKAMGAKAAQTARHYSFENNFQQVKKVYRDVAGLAAPE